MCARQLRVNEVSRFSKQSARLVLEEHSHCEVPAGCGGVVLRWRNPALGMPVVLWLFANGDQQVFIDGMELASGRPILAYGEHVLALRLTNVPRKQGLLMFAAQRSPHPGFVADAVPDPSQFFVSRDDGTWKYAVAPEGDAWRQADFDDSLWQPLAGMSIAEPAKKEYAKKYCYDKLLTIGAGGLGSPLEAPVICIRKKFTLTTEGIH